jgi:AAA+ ATPase superfamily predicted ATPase
MEKQIIIGRKIEKTLLREILQSSEAELVAVYGRRRVGKTYLIREYFKNELVFSFSGQINGLIEDQLSNFNTKLTDRQKYKTEIIPPATWPEAFVRLKAYLLPILKKKKAVIFFDEFPWIDSHKSGFLSAFDYFWNDWASTQPNLKIVICGSSASWMIRKVIRNRGGLHNRVTRRIRLLPFTLNETEAFLRSKKINLERYHITQLYMVLGGIPHYLKEIRPGESFAQTIDRICFSKDGLLRYEFNELYGSLFHKFESHLAVVKTLSLKTEGFTRKELIEKSKLSTGGTTTLVLQELEESGFIVGYIPFDKNKNQIIYKLGDEFTIFYFKFIENLKTTGSWDKFSTGINWKIWSGLAFETICHKHIGQIKAALGISGIYSEASAWKTKGDHQQQGTQIDLLIDRADQSVNICEMKFYDGKFTIDKKYFEELAQKVQIFREKTKTRKSIFVTLLTVFGLAENEYKLSRVQNEITMDDLYA